MNKVRTSFSLLPRISSSSSVSSNNNRKSLWMSSKSTVTPNTPIPTQEVTATALRSLAVVNVNGDITKLGPLMGPSKSIVIFMRHLG